MRGREVNPDAYRRAEISNRTKPTMRALAPVFSLFWITLLLQAQGPSAIALPSDVPATDVPAEQTTPVMPGQKVGLGDLLSVTVANCPQMTRSFRVASDGSLPLPLLRERIQAVGKQPEEIETEISAALIKEEILVRPTVMVAVIEYRSVPVTVLGAVHHPTTFQAVGVVTLLDAITRAEGLTSDAGAEILVGRTAGGAEPAVVRRIPVKGLIDDADPNLNIRLYGGEEVRVPPAGKVFVMGNVKKSGAFPVTDGSDATVMKAIALSEGLAPYYGKEAFIVRKADGKSQPDEIPVELSKILDRKSPDVPLQANDILYIPDSRGKRLTAQTIEHIIGFGSTAGSGWLIWH